MVKVTASAMNIKSGTETSFPVVGCIEDEGVYTIVEQKASWGRLKPNTGWIHLGYTKKV